MKKIFFLTTLFILLSLAIPAFAIGTPPYYWRIAVIDPDTNIQIPFEGEINVGKNYSLKFLDAKEYEPSDYTFNSTQYIVAYVKEKGLEKFLFYVDCRSKTGSECNTSFENEKTIISEVAGTHDIQLYAKIMYNPGTEDKVFWTNPVDFKTAGSASESKEEETTLTPPSGGSPGTITPPSTTTTTNTISLNSEKCSAFSGKPKETIYCFFRKIVRYLAWIVSILMVLMIMASGFLFITAGGSPDKVTKAKNALTAAIVGAIITFSAWAIVIYVGRILGLSVPTTIESGKTITPGATEIQTPNVQIEIPGGEGTTLPETEFQKNLPAKANVIRVNCVYLTPENRELIYTCYENWDNARVKAQELKNRAFQENSSCAPYDSAYDAQTLLINEAKNRAYCDDQGASGNCPYAQQEGEKLFKEVCLPTQTSEKTTELTCAQVRDTIKSNYNEAKTKEEDSDTSKVYIRGIEWIGETAKIYYKDDWGVTAAFYDEWAQEKSRVVVNWIKTKTHISVPESEIKNTCPTTTTTPSAPVVTPTEGIVLTRIDQPYNSQKPQGLIINLPSGWQWTTKLDQNNIKGIQDQANKGDFHIAGMSKQDGSNTLKRSIEVRDYRNVSPWGAHLDPAEYYKAKKESGGKQSPPSAYRDIKLDGKPALEEIIPSTVNGTQYVQIQVITVYCDSVYSIWLDNKIIAGSSIEQDFINWASKLKFNYSCESLTTNPVNTVKFDAYIIELYNGQTYPVNIVDDQPFVVAGDQYYGIESEKSGAYAKNDLLKQNIAFSNMRNKSSFFPAAEKDGKIITLLTDELPFKYLELKNNIAGDYSGIVLDNNEIVVGDIYIPTTVQGEAEGREINGVLVEGWNENSDAFIKTISEMQNKFGAKIKIFYDTDMERDAYYGIDYSTKVPEILITHSLIEDIGNNERFLEMIAAHEYGHFYDDILSDGVAQGNSNFYYSMSGKQLSGIFQNIVGLAINGSQMAEKIDLIQYKQDQEKRKLFDDLTNFQNDWESFINHFYSMSNVNANLGFYSLKDPSEVFATIFAIYNLHETEFDDYINQTDNKVLKNSLGALYISMRELFEENFSFPYDVNKFGQMSYEDLATGDFPKKVADQIDVSDFSKPSSFGCDVIGKYYRGIYESKGLYVMGMQTGDSYLMVFWKEKEYIGEPDIPISYTYHIWDPEKKEYVPKVTVSIGTNHHEVINVCRLS